MQEATPGTKFIPKLRCYVGDTIGRMMLINAANECLMELPIRKSVWNNLLMQQSGIKLKAFDCLYLTILLLRVHCKQSIGNFESILILTDKKTTHHEVNKPKD